MSTNDPRHADSWFAPTLATSTADQAWEATRAHSIQATQVMRIEDEEGDGRPRDIGRLVGSDQRELFVSCGPVEAMVQQFDVLQPSFIALHDLGSTVSRRLLASIARAGNRSVQRLTIRRQGYGTPLASLEFVEWSNPRTRSAPASTTIRLYSTESDTDPASRAALAQLLLARSRLGLIFVGDLAGQALADALQPIEYAIGDRGWLNRHLLLLPLGPASALLQPATRLGGRSGVVVRATPQVSRPAEAWGYLSGTWNRLREQWGEEGRHLPILAAVGPNPAQAAAAPPQAPPPSVQPPSVPPHSVPPPSVPPIDPAPSAVAMPPATRRPVAPVAPPHGLTPVPPFPPLPPLPMRPMPELPVDAAAPVTLEATVTEYLERLGKLNGVLASCVFDGATSAPVAILGEDYDADTLSREGHVLFDAMSQTAEAFGMTLGLPEMAITLETHHLLLRPLPQQPELIVLSVIDRSANLTLVRLQIQRLDDPIA